MRYIESSITISSHKQIKALKMIKVQKFELKKIIEINKGSNINGVAKVVQIGNDEYHLHYNSTGHNNSVVTVVTQKQDVKSFKTIKAIEQFCRDVGLSCFSVSMRALDLSDEEMELKKERCKRNLKALRELSEKRN